MNFEVQIRSKCGLGGVDKGEEGVKESKKFADIISESSLTGVGGGEMLSSAVLIEELHCEAKLIQSGPHTRATLISVES